MSQFWFLYLFLLVKNHWRKYIGRNCLEGTWAKFRELNLHLNSNLCFPLTLNGRKAEFSHDLLLHILNSLSNHIFISNCHETAKNGSMCWMYATKANWSLPAVTSLHLQWNKWINTGEMFCYKFSYVLLEMVTLRKVWSYNDHMKHYNAKVLSGKRCQVVWHNGNRMLFSLWVHFPYLWDCNEMTPQWSSMFLNRKHHFNSLDHVQSIVFPPKKPFVC